jgi:hypothetical protein
MLEYDIIEFSLKKIFSSLYGNLYSKIYGWVLKKNVILSKALLKATKKGTLVNDSFVLSVIGKKKKRFSFSHNQLNYAPDYIICNTEKKPE